MIFPQHFWPFFAIEKYVGRTDRRTLLLRCEDASQCSQIIGRFLPGGAGSLCYIEIILIYQIRTTYSSNQTVYCGFDPTASSLHVGNLLALIGLIHFQRLGHQPIALVGGATALIGDPTHRSVERERLEREAANENAKKIAETIAAVFENHEREFWNCDSNESNCLPPLKPPIIVNNQDWYSSTNVIDFLHETGRHFRMNSLLGRSSVKDRMESQDGMSLTEFLYQGWSISGISI